MGGGKAPKKYLAEKAKRDHKNILTYAIPKIKPVIEIKSKKTVIYPTRTLDPLTGHQAADKLEVEFKENHMLIHAFIDGAGNSFKLKYDEIGVDDSLIQDIDLKQEGTNNG